MTGVSRFVKDGTLTRRSFASAGGFAALSALAGAQVKASTERPDNPAPHPEQPDRRIGYAVVGIGEVASTQAIPAFSKCQRSKLVALVTGEPSTKGAQYAAELGIDQKSIYDYGQFDELKNNPQVQAVYIALPNSMHKEYTVRSARAGKHVLCEKPMANSVEDCDAMIDATKSAGKKLMIAYRQQYEPYNRELVRLFRGGELGSPVAMFATNGQNQDDPKQWRENLAMAGGGSLVDVGVYCLNAARFVTGEEPIEILAQESSDRNDPRFKEIEDRVLFSLKFPSGFVANLMSFYSGHGTQYLRVTGSRQWAEMNPSFGYHGLQLRMGRSEKDRDVIEQIVLGDVDQFANEIDHFSRCIQENREPHTPGEEGRQDVFLIKRIYEAIQSGKAVTLPEVKKRDAFRGSEPTY